MRLGKGAVRAAFAAAAFMTTTKGIEEQKFIKEPIETVRPQKLQSDIQLSRKIVNPCDHSGLQLRLFQFQSCPFCCKLRAFLDYYGFSYEVVEVNPVTKSELSFSKEYKKVPVLSSTDGFYTESSLIISKLATYMKLPGRTLSEIDAMYPMIEAENGQGGVIKCYPNKYFVLRDTSGGGEELASDREERQWRAWVDDHFIHLISPNVYRTFDESLETFEWFSEFGEWERNFSTWGRILAKYVGALIMWLVSKRLKKRHNIEDERKALSDAFAEWMDAIGPNREYLGGPSPNLADLAMYGAMVSFYGCSAFRELLVEGTPIQRWYTNMTAAVSEHRGRQMLENRLNNPSK